MPEFIDGRGLPVGGGLVGAVAPARFVGGTVSGAPSTGTFAVGDFAIDETGKIQICTVAGTPGTWVAAGGAVSVSATPFPWTNSPSLLASGGSAIGANRALYHRVQGSGSVSNLRYRVTASSGNVSLAVYNSTGTGISTAPNTRQQTSGAIACPAVGTVSVALGGSVTVDSTFWFAISADNGTATQQAANGADNEALASGVNGYQATAHPLPATASMTQNDGSVGGLALCILGV